MTRLGLGPIWRGMRQRKSAYLSLIVEVALGFTVVVYALALSGAIAGYATAPAGFDDSRTFVVAFEQAPGESPRARRQREKAELTALAGVQAVAQIELPPLSRREMPEELETQAGPRIAWILRGDENVAQALAVRLASGRFLSEADATSSAALGVLVTRSLAEKIGPYAEGSTIAAPGLGKAVIVGVVDNLVRLDSFLTNPTDIVFSPQGAADGRRSRYLVHVSASLADGFAREALAKLSAVHSRFVCLERLSDTRGLNERNVIGGDRILSATAIGMVLVVLVGSLGMASSFVVERTRQIAIRRALGARRSDILQHFLLENLLATLLGLLLGILVCVLLDAAVRPLQGRLVLAWAERIPIGLVIFILTGNVAALLPALRAARIPCAAASRSQTVEG